MSMNNGISSVKIIIEADCSNLVGGTESGAEKSRNTRGRESTGKGRAKEKSAILCQIFSRKEGVFRRVFEGLKSVNN
jgi:hypothetical protein